MEFNTAQEWQQNLSCVKNLAEETKTAASFICGEIEDGELLEETSPPAHSTTANIEAKICQLELRMELLENSVHSGNNGHYGMNARGGTISKENMLKMITEAIASGHAQYGVSRSYIRKYLSDKYEVPGTTHYNKKLNFLLHRGLEDKVFVFDPVHQLFKM